MIKIRDFTFVIKDNLEIDIKYRDRLINRQDIECISKSDTINHFYKLETSNQSGYYHGYIIDDKDKILKDIKKINRKLK